MFTRRADSRGALTGCLTGFISLLGLYLYQNGAFTPEVPELAVSFIWFSLFGALITLLVGLVASTKTSGHPHPQEAESRPGQP